MRLPVRPRGWSRLVLMLAMASAMAVGQEPVAASGPTVPPAQRVIEADMQKVKGPLSHTFNLCVGSAHAAMELHKENLDQLARVHRELGFQFVRFHGLLTDDMDVYHEKDGKPVYQWAKVDQLYDSILALGMKPFVELSFMPNALASGSQLQFYWNANVTPPKDPARWAALVQALVTHLQSRYGHDEVAKWYFEVWNEPNYPGFWPDANQKAYFDLYDVTAPAIKRVSQDYRVGGPATAGAGWVPEFIQHAVDAKVPVDFISTHTYAVESGFLDSDGKADLVLSADPGAITGDIRNVRHQIQTSPLPRLPLHFTEWSSSYSSRDPVHDSYTNAAFVLDKFKNAEPFADSMSYWTYSDLFEENGPPPAAFHGGFGLLTRDNVPKATFFAFKYRNELGDTELENSDPQSWTTKQGSNAQALLWDFTHARQTEGNKSLYRKLLPPAEAAPVLLKFDHLQAGSYTYSLYRTGYKANDAYSRYIEMGLPKDLDAKQLATLQALTQDEPQATQQITVTRDGTFHKKIRMRQNDIVLVTLTRN